MNDDGINVSVESKFLLQPKVGDNGYQNQKKTLSKSISYSSWTFPVIV